MVAADVLRGDMPISHWQEIDKGVILDVREPFELAVENVEGAVNIPLGQLRARLNELPKDKMIHVILPFRSTRLLRYPRAASERFQGMQHLRGDAVQGTGCRSSCEVQ